MRFSKFILNIAIVLTASTFNYRAQGVSYSVDSYMASIKNKRFIPESKVKIMYSRKIVLLRGVKGLLDREKWICIKKKLTENPWVDIAETVSLELNVDYDDVQAISRELKLIFGISHIYKEVVINLDNMQQAYCNLSQLRRARR